jgi:hypothetical protein
MNRFNITIMYLVYDTTPSKSNPPESNAQPNSNPPKSNKGDISVIIALAAEKESCSIF